MDDLAVRDLKGKWPDEPSPDDLAGWVQAMSELLADVTADEQYVCFDGVYVPTSASGLHYQGWHAAHDLEFVPQVAALDDYSITETILANMDYWQSNALPNDRDA